MSSLVLDKGDYDVLNVVAIKKMATAADAARDSGVAPAEAADRLAALAALELVVLMGDSALPTDEAGPRLAEAAAVHYAAVRQDPEVAAKVERFETLNSQFLATMTSWQQVDTGGRKVANDHGDAAYDDRVIRRLEQLVRRLGDLLTALAGHDPRFEGYRRRFDAALGAVDSGDHGMVSSPTADSLHTVWFEFHEDLLRTLGRDRAE